MAEALESPRGMFPWSSSVSEFADGRIVSLIRLCFWMRWGGIFILFFYSAQYEMILWSDGKFLFQSFLSSPDALDKVCLVRIAKMPMAQALITSRSSEISGTGSMQTLKAFLVQDFLEYVVTAAAVNCFQSNVTALLSEIAVLISYWVTFIGHPRQCWPSRQDQH